jgi:hypothetical protein
MSLHAVGALVKFGKRHTKLTDDEQELVSELEAKVPELCNLCKQFGVPSAPAATAAAKAKAPASSCSATKQELLCVNQPAVRQPVLSVPLACPHDDQHSQCPRSSCVHFGVDITQLGPFLSWVDMHDDPQRL